MGGPSAPGAAGCRGSNPEGYDVRLNPEDTCALGCGWCARRSISQSGYGVWLVVRRVRTEFSVDPRGSRFVEYFASGRSASRFGYIDGTNRQFESIRLHEHLVLSFRKKPCDDPVPMLTLPVCKTARVLHCVVAFRIPRPAQPSLIPLCPPPRARNRHHQQQHY